MANFKINDIVIAKKIIGELVYGKEYIINGLSYCPKCCNQRLDIGLTYPISYHKENCTCGANWPCVKGEEKIDYYSSWRFEKVVGIEESIKELLTNKEYETIRKY